MKWLTDEFTHTLRNGVKVTVACEGAVYRDEFGQAWIEDLEFSFAIESTRLYVGSLNCLQAELGAIKGHAEDRLVEAHDESQKEAS